MPWVSISVVAELYAVSPQSIRNWEREGMFEVKRTRGGHRRFYLEETQDDSAKKTVIYSRVSSQDQKQDLKRQTGELVKYCGTHDLKNVEIIEEIGSGMNYRKRGLRKMVRMMVQGDIEHVVISFKDRLVRFGADLLAHVAK